MIKSISSFFKSFVNIQIDLLFDKNLVCEFQLSEISHKSIKKQNSKNSFYFSFLSVSIRFLPVFYGPAILPCFILSMLLRDKSRSSSILFSSFIFFEEQIDEKGEHVIIYKLQNILLAGLGTALLGSLLGYLLYPTVFRTKLRPPLSKLPDFLPVMDLEQNCAQISHLHGILTKFVEKNQSRTPNNFEVQSYVMRFVFEDLQIMRDFLNNNESWVVELSNQNKSIKKCLDTLPLIAVLCKQACSSSSKLQVFCDSIQKIENIKNN